MREVSLETLMDIEKRCLKTAISKCNECELNDEYGDECIRIKDQNALKYLEELHSLKNPKEPWED